MAAVASARHSAGSPHLAANKSLTASPRSQPARAPAQETKPHASASPVLARGDHNAQDSKDSRDAKDTHTTASAPLAPPPKPSESGAGNGNNDFFSQHNPAHLAKEPNPFENAFGTADTPGKTALPGVTSLTSPAPLLPGNTPGWPGSLRSGPLSPAMLAGPTGSNDYFNSDHHFAGSFPTPTESSLRTGLTPGGGGSMFPQPSPNSQALYNQLQSGGATPGTLDFHRTAMQARAQSQASHFGQQHHQNGGATSQPHNNNSSIQPDLDNAQSHQRQDQDPFGSHQTTDAANGLYMLAQAGGQRNARQQQQQQQQQFNSQQQQQRAYAQGNQGVMDDRVAKNSVVSTVSGSNEGEDGHYSDGENGTGNKSQAKRSKKGGSNSKAATNGKRKTDETPSKPPAGKKHRGSTGSAMMMEPDDEEDDEEDMDEMREMTTADGRKMTDEEKRKNFLERNRIAALKCRQRKKQWLQNLQQKVEIFSTENDALAATVTQLREEIVGLKTLLLAHKDCPVSQAQGIAGMTMQQIAGDAGQGHYANPYGMPQHQQQQMQQAAMQRR